MLYRWLFLMLLPSLAFGQAAPSGNSQTKPSAPASTTAKPASPAARPAAPSAAAKEPAAEVPPDAPVITLNGLCEAKPGSPKPTDCKTVVTRAEFERMVSALTGQPLSQLPPQMRQQAANRIAQVMIVSHQAEKDGIQNKPATQEVLRFMRMNTLAQELVRSLQEKYAHPPAEEIQKYYNDHKDDFEEAKMKRIFIPKPRPETGTTPAGEPAPAKKPVDENAVKATAEKIHAEAAAGTDFDKLEKEAFEAAGIKTPPPPTDLGTVRKANAPESHKQVFQLKPGEVSQLLPDPSGFYIYKMESKQIVPLDKAQPEIEKKLSQEKLEKAGQEITNSAQTVLNPAYFGSAAPGDGAAVPPQPAKPAPQLPAKPPTMRK